MATAIVTGAGKGIGLAIAQNLAEAGYRVLANYRSGGGALEALRAGDARLAERLVPCQGDVALEADCQKLVTAALALGEGLELLVNNAGITRDGLLLRMSEADFQAVMDTNAKGAFLMLKHAAKAMLKARRGVVVNISSVSGILGNAGQINYAASKAALIAMTKSAARELAGAGIRVNAIAPGFIETSMTEQLNEKIRESFLRQIPLKRFGAAEDIAAAVRFLASEEARYITGATLNIDGGLCM